MARRRYLFVTGKLAERTVHDVLTKLAPAADFDYELAVLPITVAALIHAEWLNRKLQVPEHIDEVIVPGWCQGDLRPLEERWGVPFRRGPKEIQDLPEHFGREKRPLPALDEYSIEILAEINHAPRLSLEELLRTADQLRQAGADVIDLGCIPGEVWADASLSVKELLREGHRLSIDSFERAEVEAAVGEGVKLVLSANSSNIEWAEELDVEWVALPDVPDDLASLERTAERLNLAGRRVRWDAILEPIGFGFAASLDRYQRVRREHPDVAMLMGVGNVSELSEVDSSGVNFLLAAICEELQIGSILTTQVANWCRSSVQEFDAARRLVRYSIDQRRLPKRLDGRLLMLRDAKLREFGQDALNGLAQQITDPNFRIFAEQGEVHMLNRDGYWHGPDPYEVFDRMLSAVGSLTAEHAFYLGMELMKARTALTLGKQYIQDESLRWGLLTIDEISALERRRSHRTAVSRPAAPRPQPEPTP